MFINLSSTVFLGLLAVGSSQKLRGDRSQDQRQLGGLLITESENVKLASYTKCAIGLPTDTPPETMVYIRVAEAKTVLGHFREARRCEGKLASITSAEENYEASKCLPSSNSYIGGSKPWNSWWGQTEIFSWDDDSAFDYTNWYPGEPNNAGALNERCMVMYGEGGDYQWADDNCWEEKNAIYKVPYGSPCVALSLA